MSHASRRLLIGLSPRIMRNLPQAYGFRGKTLFGSLITAPLVDDYPEVATWLGRVLGFGHGAHSPLSSEEAIAIARAATPAALPEEDCSAALGFQVGQQVSVAATDYGVDPVQGELLCVSDESIILRRQDERAGTVHVHFPRLGFSLTAL